MCVNYSADLLKLLVEPCVSGRIRRRIHCALDLVAVKIDNDHVLGLKVFIRNTAGLDDEELLLSVNAADVAPCKGD